MNNFTQYIIQDDKTIRDALIALDRISSGALTLFIVDKEQKIQGTLTDGDIRRKLITGTSLDDSVKIAMHTKFSYLVYNQIDVDYINDCKKRRINLLPILDEEHKILKILNLKIRKSMLPIDAVLMAGGKGERLRPLTETTPKPLIKVGDKCIIDYNIDSLIEYGVENISVTVNYLKEQIEEHYKEPRKGVQVNCIREPHYLGTMGSIKFIPEFKNDTILVMNSDLFTNVDYEDFYLHFLRNNADISVLSIPYSYNIPYGIFDLEGRDIKGLIEKPTYNYYANGGIYLIKKDLLKLIPNEDYFNATDLIEKAIEKGYKAIRFPLTGYWIDIGKHADYNKAQELVKHL